MNTDIIFSDKRIYNQDESNNNWQYYEYASGTIHHPISLIHINEIPYILEDNNLINIDIPSTRTGAITPLNTSLDTITYVREFGSESIVVGEKNGKHIFILFDGTKRFFGEFGAIQPEGLRIEKINGVYIFVTKNNVYAYYKGSREIFNILSSPIVGFVDSLVFFKKDGKVSVLDVLRK